MRGGNVCKDCGAPLGDDDIAIYRKLVNRGAERFCCIDCLSAYFGCTRTAVEELIRYYRETGKCTLFR